MPSIIYLITISILFSSIGQVASDLYLPSLPAIAQAMHASANLSQATMFAYMIGFACSRLIYGPISDAVGRKKPLIVGLLILLIGTIVCVSANSIFTIIIGRFLQGLGSGAGVVLAVIIIRDVSEGADLAKLFSYLTMSNIFMIASAPLLGGYFQHWFGWRANFIFLTVYAGTALLVSIVFLKETHKHKTIENLRPEKLKNNLITVLTSREFIIYTFCIFLTYSGILAWLTLGPILLQNFVGITPVGFGQFSLIIGIFYALGAFLNSKLIKKYDINKMLLFAAFLFIIAGFFMLFFALLGMLNVWVVVVPVIIFMLGSSIIFPNAFAGALTPFAKIAGIAGAMLGFIQILGGTLSSGLISILPDNTQIPLAAIFIFCGLTALFAIRKIKV